MSQCVPSWDFDDDSSPTAKFSSTSNISRSCYEVAELTWENGQLAKHSLGPPRVPSKPIPVTAPSKHNIWDKPRAGGTLESIVNQATYLPQPQRKPGIEVISECGLNEIVPRLDHRRAASSTVSDTMTMDAMVPCPNPNADDQYLAATAGLRNYVVGSSTRVGSYSGATATNDEEGLTTSKRERVVLVPVAAEWSGRDQSVSGSATFGRESQRVTVDTYDRELGLGFTSTSFGSQDNTSCGKPDTKTATDNDSASRSRPQMEVGDEEEKKKGQWKSSASTKRSRAAAIHNQSERKRRDKINQRMKTLQKLVPNSSKTDKASMLDEVIEYLKQLQAQIQMMSRMNVQPMMLPVAMQQQLQMSMLTPPMNMGLGLGMGMGVMDPINSLNRANIATVSPLLHPAAFLPMTNWDGSATTVDSRLQPNSATLMRDPMTAAFLACQSQPITMDAYSRMAAMYQQLQQQPPTSRSKS